MVEPTEEAEAVFIIGKLTKTQLEEMQPFVENIDPTELASLF